MRKNKAEAMRKRRLPPRDSWIRLAPGKGVCLDARLTKLWKKEESRWREVRGNILMACFDLEYLLDQVLCEVFFPGLNKAPSNNVADDYSTESYEDAKVLKNLFDDLFFKSALIPFSRKIELLKNLSLQIPILQKLMSQELVGKLHKIRDVRNRFAHYPITFTPIGDVPDQDLRVNLVCRDKELELNQEFFDEYEPLFSEAQSEMEAILKQLQENPSRR